MPLTAMQGAPSTFAGLGWEPPESEGPSFRSEGPSVIERWLGLDKPQTEEEKAEKERQKLMKKRLDKDAEDILKREKFLSKEKERYAKADREKQKQLNKEREKLLKEKKKLEEKLAKKEVETSSDAGAYVGEGLFGLGDGETPITLRNALIIGGAAVAIWYILKKK